MSNFTVHWKPIIEEVVDYPNIKLYATAGSLVVVILWQYWQNTFSIPTYGGIWSFSRTLAALKLNPRGREQCLEAYVKDPIMLVPRTDVWVALAHSKYVEEIARAPDDVLSFMDSTDESIQTRWTFGPKFLQNHYHLDIIKNQLTRNLANLFPDVYDETILAVSEYGGEIEDWKTVNVFSFAQKLVTRASNRIFVGKSLCRNEKWLSLMINNAMDVMKTSYFINLFPRSLRPVAGWYFSSIKKTVDDATRVGGAFVQEKIDEHGNEPANDYLSWLIDSAPENERNPRDIISRVVATNFVAIHTSSITLTNGLYWLMARPEYWAPLREEIESTTLRLGWTKDAIGAMVKLDSFMRECMRITPIGTQVMSRKVRKPFTFSNGFRAPVGMTISAHLYATHHDKSLYPHADEFDGFRFVPVAVEDGGKETGTGVGVKKTMYTTSRSYLAFGHGRHACPGRFFASMEVKLVLAYLIANYDMKWPEKVYTASVPGYTAEGYRPLDISLGHRMMPDRTSEMLIRKRVDARVKFEWNASPAAR